MRGIDNIGPFRVHLCTPTQDQLPYYTALRKWLTKSGHTVLTDLTAPLDARLRAATFCDLCILLLGPTFGACAPLSSFSDTELETSTATDAHPGKLLVFTQDIISQSTSPEQREFIERERHFAGGSFSASFHSTKDLITQVRTALSIWRPPEPHGPPPPLEVPSNAVMISSVSALAPAREVIRNVLLEQPIPVIDYLHAPGEAVTPIDLVISWARQCRALLLILDKEYGYVSPVDGLGVTELEFVTALRAGRPIFAFLGPGARDTRDADQQQFVERVHSFVPYRLIRPFATLAELRGQAREALALLEKGLPSAQLESVPADTQRRWYRRQLHRWLGVLPHLTQPQGMPLEQVYVSLQTLPHVQLEQESGEQEALTSRHSALEAQQATPYKQVFAPEDDIEERAKQEQKKVEPRDMPIAVDEALKRYQRFVLRGNPGAGKSVVLRWYAISAPEQTTPVFIRLAAYARTRQERQAEGQFYSLLEAITDEENRLALNSTTDTSAWREALQAGQGLVLLDAFDEVPMIQQPEIASEIQALASQIPMTTHIVVTARIIGFNTQLGPSFTVTEVQPLKAEQQQQLVEQWLRTAHRNESEGQTIAHARAHRLISFLANEKRLAEWARVPLLLTFLAALVDAPGADTQRLPTTKAVIYRRVLRLILGRWRTLNLRRSGEYLHLKEQLLLALARSSTLDGYSEVITAEEIASNWSQISANIPRSPTASEIQNLLASQDGILIQLREGQYAFFHPTFQEYLAASLLAVSNARECQAVLVRRRLSNRWEEVTQLLVSELDRVRQPAAADDVVESLIKWDEQQVPVLDAPDPFHSALARATRCHVMRDPVFAASRLRSILIKRWRRVELEAHELPDAKMLGSDTLGLMALSQEMLIVLGGMKWQQVRSSLRNLRASRYDTRREAEEELNRLGPAVATPEVLQTLVYALDHGQDRGTAAEVLGQLGSAAATPQVIAALIRTFSDTTVSEHVKLKAGQALGKLGPLVATPMVLQTLIRALEYGDDQDVAATALGQLGPAAATPQVIAALIDVLTEGREKRILPAAEALVRLGPAGVIALCSLGAYQLSRVFEIHPVDYASRTNARSSVVKAFRLGPAEATAEVITALTDVLERANTNKSKEIPIPPNYPVLSGHGNVRELSRSNPPLLWTALADWQLKAIGVPSRIQIGMAQMLGQLGPAAATSRVIAALTDALNEGEVASPVQVAAAKALSQLGPIGMRALTRTLGSTDRGGGWVAAVGALGQVGQAAATQEVITALTDALETGEPSVQVTAAETLGQLGSLAASRQVMGALTRILTQKLRAVKDDEDRTLRSTAAKVLGQFGPVVATQDVIDALTHALEDAIWRRGTLMYKTQAADRTEVVRALGELGTNAAEALGQLGSAAATSEVIQALIRAARDFEVGSAAVRSLGQLGSAAATPEMIAALTQALNSDTRSQTITERGTNAAEALGQLGQAAATTGAIDALIQAVGQTYGRRRFYYSAAHALGQLGPAAATPQVVGKLAQALDEKIRAAGAALTYIGGPGHRILIAGLRSPDRDKYLECAYALKSVIPTIEDATAPIHS